MIVEDSVLKDRILNVLQSNPDGVEQIAFQNINADIPVEKLCKILNNLTSQGLVEIFQTKTKHMLWKLKLLNIISMERKLSSEEARINKQIRNSGAKGISRNLLKKNNNMKEVDFAKAENRLVDIGLIKQYMFNNNKIYVAIDVVPDSGYSEKFYVMENKKTMETRISYLRESILEFIKTKYNQAMKSHTRIMEQRRASMISLQSIHNHMESSSNQKIKKEELRLIVESLVNSENIVSADLFSTQKPRCISDEELSNFCYRYSPSVTKKRSNLASVPCILCPHKDYCSPSKAISPENCHYLTEYLTLF